MGGGLAFLTKKSFNPANWSNQKQVWEARQKDGIEKRRIAERESQLRREREEEDLARVVGGEEARGRKALSFMYEAGKVPGLDRKVMNNDNSSIDVVQGYGSTVDHEHEDDGNRKGRTSSLFERQPGDDDAAAAFRAMLARGTLVGDQPESSSSTLQTLQGDAETKNATTSENDDKEEDAIRDRDLRTNLEKAVGRGITSGSGVTLAQQMERFPMLKGAPRVLPKSSGGGDDGKESSENDVVGLNFKPLGQVLRNVKCLKCGVWGHSMGDRECGVSGWNPFAPVPTTATMMSAPSSPQPAAIAAVPASAPIISAGTRKNDLLGRKRRDEKEIQKTSSPERMHKKRSSRKHKRSRRAPDKDGRHHHKRRKSGDRRHDRSPSNSSHSDSSSSSSSSSISSRRGHHHRRHHDRRQKYDSNDESVRFDQQQHRQRKESGNYDNRRQSSRRRHERTHSSSRRHKHRDRYTRSRSRSRSPSTSE